VPESTDPLWCLCRQVRHCVAVWELFTARSTCPSWAAKAGMDMLQGDIRLAGETRTHSVGYQTSEPFLKTMAGVALNCQKGHMRKDKERAYCRDNAIIHRLRHFGICHAWDRW